LYWNLKIGNINIQIPLGRKDALVVMVWALIISLIMINAHIAMYNSEPEYYHAQAAYVEYRAPSLGIMEMLILPAMAIVVAFILSDIKPILYGFVVSLVLSFIIAVTYVTLFIWYVLGYGEVLTYAYSWEDAIYLGFLNVIFIMVPWVIGASAIGLVIGLVIRGWMKPT
jgi:hypothetical protein